MEPAGRKEEWYQENNPYFLREREKLNWCGILTSYKPIQLSLHEGKPRFKVVLSVTTFLRILVLDAKHTASHIQGGHLNGKMSQLKAYYKLTKEVWESRHIQYPTSALQYNRRIILKKCIFLIALQCAHSCQRPMSLLYETYLCDVSTTDWPDFWIDVSTVHRFRLATGSTPLVGSSRKTIGGFPIRAIAVLSLRLLPPLYVPHCWFSYS